MTEAPILAGAEPFSAPGGPHGALVLHGFTGSPQSMRGLAGALAAAGFATELPLLPGHGTNVDDMLTTGWPDWSGAAEAAYEDLASRTDRVVVAGLSMGGTLAVWLAERHEEIAGVIAVNPAVEPPDTSIQDMLRDMKAGGADRFPAIGNDVADPDQIELAYPETPIEPLLGFIDAMGRVKADLGRIRSPMLLMTSPQDHVVDPVSSDVLAGGVTCPLDRVTLEKSFHVATLDFDRDELERRAVEFARRVTS